MSEEEKTIIAPALSDESPETAEEVKTPVLVAFAGQLLGQSWELGVGEISIGRSTNSTIQVTEGGVSREHARLVCGGDGANHAQGRRTLARGRTLWRRARTGHSLIQAVE